MELTPDGILLATSITTFLSGFMLGVYSVRGYLFVSPELAAERDRNLHDPVESDESDVEEGDTILDHAPNWANGLEADARDGLRLRNQHQAAKRFDDDDDDDDVTSGKKKKKKKQGSKKSAAEGQAGPGVPLAAGSGVPESNSISKEECKLVLVVRTDLGMTKGKIAAQCSHATLACYKSLSTSSSSSPSARQLLQRWERHGQAKIALQTRSEQELLELLGKARGLGLTAEVVQDAGRTQIDPGSLTVLGVGPAPKSLVDQVTGGLKLL